LDAIVGKNDQDGRYANKDVRMSEDSKKGFNHFSNEDSTMALLS
jgi:hypothetical protein